MFWPLGSTAGDGGLEEALLLFRLPLATRPGFGRVYGFRWLLTGFSGFHDGVQGSALDDGAENLG